MNPMHVIRPVARTLVAAALAIREFFLQYVMHPRWTAQYLYDISVFKPIRMSEIIGADKVLVALFHRSAATIYALYSMWGVAATIGGIPSIAETAGAGWQLAFSSVVALISIPCAVGATWFPKTGRLEMFAASSMVALLLVYFCILNYRGIAEGTPSINITSILIFSLCVIPAARVAFVYRYLLDSETKRNVVDVEELISRAGGGDDVV